MSEITAAHTDCWRMFTESCEGSEIVVWKQRKTINVSFLLEKVCSQTLNLQQFKYVQGYESKISHR